MSTSFDSIIGSTIFNFVVGHDSKEYSIHGAAISGLSRPLDVLLNGEMREAEEKRVDWSDVDEKTFVRFAQWAYTKDYDTEEPEIVLDHSSIEFPSCGQGDPEQKQDYPGCHTVPEIPLYSLVSHQHPVAPREQCRDQNCKIDPQNFFYDRQTCLLCGIGYDTMSCPRHSSELKFCSRCVQVLRPHSKKSKLISKFLDESGAKYPTSTSNFKPRKNTEGCEDYTGVFLCHAKLYVLGDKYDIPSLRQLALHRLHAMLKEFTLYPSRFNDIATLAKYVFDNTVPEDSIREIITLYYACIVEDAMQNDGLRSLIDDIPDFAFDLISMMNKRLD